MAEEISREEILDRIERSAHDYEKEFPKAGGYEECARVVGKAARLAAELILG